MKQIYQMRALIIIDMQKGSFTPETPRHNAIEVIGKINALAHQFRQNGEPVIYVQHDGTKENEFIPGSENWQILSELIVEPEDILVSKTANDAFYQTELNNILLDHGVTQLVVTGSATDFCVEATVQSALVKDYDITVIGDAHTAADRPHASAETIINHYNWIWENLTPTKGSISVVNLADFQA